MTANGHTIEFNAGRVDEAIYYRTVNDVRTGIDQTIQTMDAESPSKMAERQQSGFEKAVDRAITKQQMFAPDDGDGELSDKQVYDIVHEVGPMHTSRALESLQERVNGMGFDKFYDEYTGAGADEKRSKLAKEISRASAVKVGDIRSVVEERAATMPKPDASATVDAAPTAPAATTRTM